MVSGDQPRSTAPAKPEEAFCPADIMLVRTWLHNRSENTARAYRADVAEFGLEIKSRGYTDQFIDAQNRRLRKVAEKYRGDDP